MYAAGQFCNWSLIKAEGAVVGQRVTRGRVVMADEEEEMSRKSRDEGSSQRNDETTDGFSFFFDASFLTSRQQHSLPLKRFHQNPATFAGG